jgi:hypothetical protein
MSGGSSSSSSSSTKINSQQQIRLEAALNREYKQLARELERVSRSREYSYEQKMSQMDQMFQRQQQIIKELETCTGLEIPVGSKQDLLEENKRIQYGDAIDDDNNNNRPSYTTYLEILKLSKTDKEEAIKLLQLFFDTTGEQIPIAPAKDLIEEYLAGEERIGEESKK